LKSPAIENQNLCEPSAGKASALPSGKTILLHWIVILLASVGAGGSLKEKKGAA